MDLFQAIVSGVVQGLTEFLPISSTAHLYLVRWFMGWDDPGLEFDVALHLGTLAALLLYFRNQWVDLIRGALYLFRGRTDAPHARMALFIGLATIPGAIAGFFLDDFVETTLRDPRVISIALIVLALVLVLAERVGRRKKDLEHITMTDALTIGVAQTIALVPGVSRSGVTITAGLFRGLRGDSAARFSFLISVPLIAGAVASQLFEIVRDSSSEGQILTLGVGIFTAAVVGYASIAFLLRYLATHSTFVFVYYRIALGIIVYLAIYWGYR